MNGASPRCYANSEERAAFLCQLQALAKRKGGGYLASDRNGRLFQEKIRARADGTCTGFERQGMALSPTVQQAGPAGSVAAALTPASASLSPGLILAAFLKNKN